MCPVLYSSPFVPITILKCQNPLLPYIQKRKYTVNVQCSVQYTLLLLYLMLVISYCWHVAHMGEERGVHRVLVRKPEGKWPLGRPRSRWEDNIKKNEMGGAFGAYGGGEGGSQSVGGET
jgi:hypothetical protein